MRIPLALAALLAVGGIGGTGQAAPISAWPQGTTRIALYAYAVDQGGLATPLGTCEEIAARDRASCLALEGAITDARRTLAYAELAKGWDAARRATFARLVAAEEAYAQALGMHETDRVVGDGNAVARAEKDVFLATLRALLQGRGEPDEAGFATLDAALNAAYARVMATRDTASLGWGNVDKAGVRRTERAWLAYRDAFVAFAATLETPGAADRVRAELTRRRTADLEGLLAD